MNLDPMSRALFNALYKEHTRFQWITFTRYEVIRGEYSHCLLRSSHY
jgi:hypothetical protein